MTSKLKLLVASSAVPLVMIGATPAFAAGTAQGTSIVNNVNVNYQVGGVAQTQQTAADTFVVDRKVIFSLAEQGSTTTTVSPGQTAQITTFVLSNTSNDTLDFTITPSQLVGGTAAHGGSDAFNVTNLLVCRDAGPVPDGVCDSAPTATITIDNLAADTNTNILVVGDIPIGATNGQVAGVSLQAAALTSAGAAFTLVGDGVVNGAGTVETVFADAAKSGNGGTSAARDGIDVATDDYTVSAALLSVFKSSRVISDGVSAGPNFKSLPGAVVEYCISVTNAVGGATATNISISDLVPTNTTYSAGTIRVNGTVTSPGAGQTCAAGTVVTDAADADAGSFGTPANTVAGSLTNITGGNSSALIFRVTLN